MEERRPHSPPIETELKILLRRSGITIRDVAVFLEVPYSTLSSQLNGVAILPDPRRQAIYKYIDSHAKNRSIAVAQELSNLGYITQNQ